MIRYIIQHHGLRLECFGLVEEIEVSMTPGQLSLTIFAANKDAFEKILEGTAGLDSYVGQKLV